MSARASIALVCAAFVAACGGIIETGENDASPEAAPVKDAAVEIESGSGEASTMEATAPEAGPFTPASLPNTVLWLTADALVKTDASGNVTSWGDRSPFKNDAATAAAYAPTLLQSGIDGHASIHFDAKSTTARYLAIADSSSLEWGKGDFVVAIVARFTNDPAAGLATGAASFYWKSTFQGQTGAGVSVWGNVPLGNGTVADGLLMLEDSKDYVHESTAYHDGVARLFVARRTGGMLELRVDGASIATQAEPAPVDVSAPSSPVLIGAVNFAYYRLFGDIAEIVALRGQTAPSELAALVAYLQSRYAL